MNDELTFAQPFWIWTGLAVCVALAFGAVRWNRRRERDLKRLAHPRLLRQLTESVSRRRRRIKQVLWIAGVFCVFLAMARPQYGFEFREVKRRGIDLVFAVDTSRSMLAEDVVPNRLERARLAITDFVEKLKGDRVALIPFAGNAFSLCPLTLDYSAFFQSLDALDTGIIPHQGTDLASAVREANRLFDEEGNNHRILILITDGEDLEGAVMEAVATAEEKGMTIHTVGVGDQAGALIPVRMPDGSQDFVRDEAGQPVRTALDEGTLRQIAEATGGVYAPLGAAGQGLETIYREKLRLVPKSELNQRLDRIPLERYEWPLVAGILLLLLEFVLGERRRARRKKARVVSAARRKAVATAVVALGVAGAASGESVDPRTVYNAGTDAYRAGDFENAEETLAEGLGATDNLALQQRGYYNLGNTRYRLGERTVEENPEATITKWEAAVKSYEDALALNPEDEDAKFNRDFVAEKLEELKKEQEKQDQEQEQDQEQQGSGEGEEQDQQESGEQEDEQSEDGESGDEQSDAENKDQSGGESGEKEGESGEKQEEKQEEAGGEGEEKSEEAEKPQPGQEGEKSDEEQEQPIPGSEQTEEQSEQTGQNQMPTEGEPAESGQPGSFSEERRAPGEMSREEAAQLFEALESDERSVIPLPDARSYRSVVPNNTTRGKTW